MLSTAWSASRVHLLGSRRRAACAVAAAGAAAITLAVPATAPATTMLDLASTKTRIFSSAVAGDGTFWYVGDRGGRRGLIVGWLRPDGRRGERRPPELADMRGYGLLSDGDRIATLPDGRAWVMIDDRHARLYSPDGSSRLLGSRHAPFPFRSSARIAVAPDGTLVTVEARGYHLRQHEMQRVLRIARLTTTGRLSAQRVRFTPTDSCAEMVEAVAVTADGSLVVDLGSCGPVLHVDAGGRVEAAGPPAANDEPWTYEAVDPLSERASLAGGFAINGTSAKTAATGTTVWLTRPGGDGRRGQLLAYDTTARRLTTLPLPHPVRQITNVTATPDGGVLAATGRCRLLRSAPGGPVASLALPFGAHGAALAPDGRLWLRGLTQVALLSDAERRAACDRRAPRLTLNVRARSLTASGLARRRSIRVSVDEPSLLTLSVYRKRADGGSGEATGSSGLARSLTMRLNDSVIRFVRRAQQSGRGRQLLIIAVAVDADGNERTVTIKRRFRSPARAASTTGAQR